MKNKACSEPNCFIVLTFILMIPPSLKADPTCVFDQTCSCYGSVDNDTNACDAQGWCISRDQIQSINISKVDTDDPKSCLVNAQISVAYERIP